MKIEYTKQGDYLIPNFEMPTTKDIVLNKFGRQRLSYLKKHKKGLYIQLKMQDLLVEHLEDIQFMADWYINDIVTTLAKQEGVTEELKATDQMEWVGRMNNLKHRAEEAVLKEIIFEGGAV